MKPCRGRIAILRDPHRAESLRAALLEAGFDVVVYPVTCVEYVGPQAGEDWPDWTRTADWVVFTSLNGVDGFAQGVGRADGLVELLRDRRVAVLGSTSAERLESMGAHVDLRESRGTAVELATALLAAMTPRSTVLYPCAEQTTPILPRALREAGHHLRQVVCYRTRSRSPEERADLDWDTLDAAFVAAPSAVHALGHEPSLPDDLGFFAVGPTTATALRDAGFKVLGVADSPRTEDVVAMLKRQC